MNPIRRAGVVAFIDWVSRKYPEIGALRDVSEAEFMELAVAYEGAKGLNINRNHNLYGKWRSTYYVLSHCESQEEALQRL